MIWIKRVEVRGLAGRTRAVQYKLNPDVNIFFGQNGSGKTGLLKILHGALASEVMPVIPVAFDSASVLVETDDVGEESRTLQRDDEFELMARELRANRRGYFHPGSIEEPIRQNGLGWQAEVKAKRNRRGASQEGLLPPNRRIRHLPHGFLSITRLTTDLSRSGRYGSPAHTLDEWEFDEIFGEALQDRWKTYTNRVLSEVRRAQEGALAQILGVVLSPQGESEATGDDIDTEQAYKRVRNFLGRQGGQSHRRSGFPKIDFGKEYKNDPKLRRVVNLIDQVEGQIEHIMKTRVALQDLVTELMGRENKKLTFTDEEIRVQLDSNRMIGLARLSSGEKQLLRVLVEATMAGPNPIIIDEPELSMHIDWQRKLLAAMRTLNPDAQIIVATHSPEIMADYEDEKIFRL
ncbi:ATP-binding protein [Micromonospora sp. LHW51205]|uniref:ATP-binding protein n=1 Tax=Micromonospora sp. LHW51205 TaxID=2248752 RepID=UPI0013148E15|nr:ATP-binding protein [Micromonospora sp. LHW51205]